MASGVTGFSPRRKFVEISITGDRCPLNCPMCGGRWLQGMNKVSSPQELIKLGKRLSRSGVKGVLISGGLDGRGKLPFRSFLGAIKEIKRNGLFVSVHPGFVEREDAELLSAAGVDLADYELLLDEGEIIRSKGLNREPEDYVRGAELLMEAGIEVIPHLTVGLPGRSEEWLGKAMEVIRDLGIRRSVVLAFIPTPLTPLVSHPLPEVDEIVRVVYGLSRVSRVSLGCMRPPQMKRELDRAVLEMVDRIANPHASLNLPIVDACCSVPDEWLDSFLDVEEE